MTLSSFAPLPFVIPVRFGSPSRQLYGAFHPPSSGGGASHGVVLCNPFGQEAIRSHRLMRVLGERLANLGHGVLRFDYYATGDSDGDDGEADLEVWIADVRRAHDELRRLCGCGDASWFGLRLGATLAALASAGASSPPFRLVLWDPIVSGGTYLAALARAHAASIIRPEHPLPPSRSAPPTGDASAPGEALGFPLTAAFRRQVTALEADSWRACRASEAWLIGEDAAAIDLVQARLRATVPRTERVRVDARIDWASHEAMNTPIAPAEVVQAIVGILGGTA